MYFNFFFVFEVVAASAFFGKMLMDVDFDDDTPNRCTTLVYYAWKIFTCLFLHVLLVTMVVLYCLLGAFAFENLEKAHEIEVSK